MSLSHQQTENTKFLTTLCFCGSSKITKLKMISKILDLQPITQGVDTTESLRTTDLISAVPGVKIFSLPLICSYDISELKISPMQLLCFPHLESHQVDCYEHLFSFCNCFYQYLNLFLQPLFLLRIELQISHLLLQSFSLT